MNSSKKTFVLCVGILLVQVASRPVRAADCTPVFDPANFVATVTNTYFPLPVGRTWIYQGVKDGQAQTDTVTVTATDKVILGIHATVVSDVATAQDGSILEKTFDWYAQDRDGNVWYLGEDTSAFGKNGKVDTSGSWEAGVNGAVAGIVMEASPQIPDAYRQEYLAGEAEDTAWVVQTGGSIRVPYGRLRGTLVTLEATAIEPGNYDQKVYAPGIGMVLEQALTGPPEVAQLVSVTGP
jgi:hypothetical protein